MRSESASHLTDSETEARSSKRQALARPAGPKGRCPVPPAQPHCSCPAPTVPPPRPAAQTGPASNCPQSPGDGGHRPGALGGPPPKALLPPPCPPPHSPGGAEGGRGSHRGPLSRQEMWGPRCGRVLRGHEGREKPRFPAASLWDSLRVGEQAEGFLGKAPRPFLVGAFPAGSFGGPGQCLPCDQAPTGHPHGEGSPGFLSPPRAAVCQPPKFRRERTRPEPAGPLRRRLQGPTRPQGGRGGREQPGGSEGVQDPSASAATGPRKFLVLRVGICKPRSARGPAPSSDLGDTEWML